MMAPFGGQTLCADFEKRGIDLHARASELAIARMDLDLDSEKD
jgi:hypothetical protein